jgi:NAD(P)-dependent dehydrogenase (short-subunit alcohol dehydrogenase family)
MSKVILVTGGSSGIGEAIARVLTQRRHVVYAGSRSAANGVAHEAGYKQITLDVTDESSIQMAVDRIISEQGRLDVLINNAGLGMAGPLENTSDLEARLIYNTNVFGVLNTCRIAAPHLRAMRGMIINITSIGGVFALPYRGIYCSSKFAVEGISEGLSLELKPHGVRVVLLQPGDVKTNINANRVNSAYVDHAAYPRFSAVLDQVHREVDHALEPETIAINVAKIISKKNPKLRYRVATPTQKLSIALNALLPGRWFEKLISRHYGIRS